MRTPRCQFRPSHSTRSRCFAGAARSLLGAATLQIFLAAAASANGTVVDLDAFARMAAGVDPAAATAAAGALRAAGPAGMAALLAHADDCSASNCAALRDRLDGVCGVRDCREIGLYWYTDLAQARAAALESGKPILSLRLMGRLDEEFSCANSRFFRTVLYKNAAIADLLRDQFVLHWRSVRPVPKVTIDFGDGTRLERTITGNSIHYVLDSRGRLVDAIPGLYGPAMFRTVLEDAERAAQRTAAMDDGQAKTWTAARAERQLQALLAAVNTEYASLGDEVQARIPVRPGTASKMADEAPLADLLLEASDETLRELAALRRPRVLLDEASRRFLLAKHGVVDPRDGDLLVDGFETTLALDEVINEVRLRPQLLSRLTGLAGLDSFDLEAFNGWVYEEVFGTPLSDPWLGLAPTDRYAALPASSRTTTAPPTESSRH